MFTGDEDVADYERAVAVEDTELVRIGISGASCGSSECKCCCGIPISVGVRPASLWSVYVVGLVSG